MARRALPLLALLAFGTAACRPPATDGLDRTSVIGAVLLDTGDDVLLLRSDTRVDPFLDDDAPLPPGWGWGAGRTRAELVRLQVLGELEGLDPGSWEAFRAANRSPRELRTLLRPGSSLTYVTEAEWAARFEDTEDLTTAYRTLFEAHPGATTLRAVSMPGLSPDGREALVYAEEGSGGHAGSGAYVLLRRAGGLWRVVDITTAWIA